MTGRQGWNLKSENRTFKPVSGADHYAWKGDAALRGTKRIRAVRRYRLTTCEACGKPATDRHHRDGDTGNNSPENIARLCRRCHMIADGRMVKFVAIAAANGHATKLDPQPCVNCGRLAKPRRKGRCFSCAMFWDRHGREWTPADIGTKGRRQTAIIAGETEDPRGN